MTEKLKKKYIKPMVAFEDMQLNSAIASCDIVYTTESACSTLMDGLEGSSYPIQVGGPDGFTFFNLSYTICKNGEYYCYHPGASQLHNIS